ncbi:MAG: putative DNA binding domain-containing protein [Bacteroidales bacterium]|nr:putative DNA binding domain-containing protein [Bacteroidales bacterium]
MESQDIEYKQSWKDDYLKWICGFANAQGGTIFIGVDDDGNVCGLNNAKKLMEDIPNKIVNYMGIVAELTLYKKDEKKYIGIAIEPNNVPISFRGKYYYRSGTTMQELNGVALQQFILKKMGHSWDDIANDSATIDDLDREAIDYFLRIGHKNGRISENELDAQTEIVLQNLNLINENGKIKNAALLLFAKRPQRYFTCVQFKIGRFGNSEANLIIQDIIEGNIIQMADRVVEVLKSKYLTSPIRFEGMNRIETLEIPEEALREIIYNAIAHKDYTGAPVQMRVWDDRVEIWNEGVLPMGYTPATLLTTHSSRPRNKNIANVFFKAGFIDAWGRGYKKIREGFEQVGLPMPTIETVDGGVKVTFKRNNYGFTKIDSENVEKMWRKCGENVEKIVKIIEEEPSITAKQIAERLGMSQRWAEDQMKKMKAQGIIRRVGPDRGGHWEIIKDQS